MYHIFFSKNCANTETLSFVDIYAVRILDEEYNHSLPALTLKLTSRGVLHYLWSAGLSKSFLSIDCVNIYFSQSAVNYLFSVAFSID